MNSREIKEELEYLENRAEALTLELKHNGVRAFELKKLLEDCVFMISTTDPSRHVILKNKSYFGVINTKTKNISIANSVFVIEGEEFFGMDDELIDLLGIYQEYVLQITVKNSLEKYVCPLRNYFDPYIAIEDERNLPGVKKNQKFVALSNMEKIQ